MVIVYAPQGRLRQRFRTQEVERIESWVDELVGLMDTQENVAAKLLLVFERIQLERHARVLSWLKKIIATRTDIAARPSNLVHFNRDACPKGAALNAGTSSTDYFKWLLEEIEIQNRHLHSACRNNILTTRRRTILKSTSEQQH